MPAAGWKSVNIEDDVHDQLACLSVELRRSVAWTANRIIENAVQDCFGGNPKYTKGLELIREIAAKHDLL